jgi:hypothetical protein
MPIIAENWHPCRKIKDPESLRETLAEFWATKGFIAALTLDRSVEKYSGTIPEFY